MIIVMLFMQLNSSKRWTRLKIQVPLHPDDPDHKHFRRNVEQARCSTLEADHSRTNDLLCCGIWTCPLLEKHCPAARRPEDLTRVVASQIGDHRLAHKPNSAATIRTSEAQVCPALPRGICTCFPPTLSHSFISFGRSSRDLVPSTLTGSTSG